MINVNYEIAQWRGRDIIMDLQNAIRKQSDKVSVKQTYDYMRGIWDIVEETVKDPVERAVKEACRENKND